MLAQHARGLIALSACRAGELIRAVERDQLDDALRIAAWHRDVFGANHYFIELQHRDGIPAMRAINRQLIEIARSLDIPLVATNDVHYLTRDDAATHDLLLAIQTQTTLSDPNRLRLDGDDYDLRAPAEMQQLFSGLDAALTNTSLIAERCHVRLDASGFHLPHFPVPNGFTPEMYLRHLAETGLAQRYASITAALQQRLDYELRVIHQMGFDRYFLIVWDLLQHARARGIHWNVRGSAAASLAAYALGLTAVDPIAHQLIFERFLNPDRVSMPDIDMDFPDECRAEMVAYAVERYGPAHVAQIVSFGTLGARAALRDVGRALQADEQTLRRVLNLLPKTVNVTLNDALAQPAFAQLYEGEPTVRSLVDYARALEGIARHTSTHPAGLVITAQPLVELVPLQRATHAKDQPQGLAPLSQYNMSALEHLRLLKLDFLGLTTLTIMQRTLAFIHARHGVSVRLDAIPLDDLAIYDLLASGNVGGVFQVEGDDFRRVLTASRPTCFADVVALLALYRPGPMQFVESFIARKHGREAIRYRHATLEPILQETYGIVVFQEQVLQSLSALAGYTGAQADTVRRAISKKNADVLQAQRAAFVAGAERTSAIAPEIAHQIWDDIEYFSGYAFSKAHATDYALITCQTAWLKAHYCIEFIASNLSVSRSDPAKIAHFISECQRCGIEVLPPCIHGSELEFVIEANAIRVGLGAIKGVSDVVVAAIIDERRARGRFAAVDEVCRRLNLAALGKKTLEALIESGALDALGERAALLASLDSLLNASQHSTRNAGQLDLFGDESLKTITLAEVPPATVQQRRAWERTRLGAAICDPPLHELRAQLERQPEFMTISALAPAHIGQSVNLVALVEQVRDITTKQIDRMAFALLSDGRASTEATIFPAVYARMRECWQADALLRVRAKVQAEKGGLQLIIESAEPLLG
ncbi:MAG: DNA polymerase III subunit alpha, partial [Chloroflexi bacterium]|nr:DNA polymerase III subunit alpha [Chloroflexota bacterium]